MLQVVCLWNEVYYNWKINHFYIGVDWDFWKILSCILYYTVYTTFLYAALRSFYFRIRFLCVTGLYYYYNILLLYFIWLKRVENNCCNIIVCGVYIITIIIIILLLYCGTIGNKTPVQRVRLHHIYTYYRHV